MKMRFRRLPALLLAFVLLLGLIGCGETNTSAAEEQEELAVTQEQPETAAEEAAETGETPAAADSSEAQTPPAEAGAETEEQEALLRLLEPDGVQGFRYHRPMPIDDFAALLQKN